MADLAEPLTRAAAEDIANNLQSFYKDIYVAAKDFIFRLQDLLSQIKKQKQIIQRCKYNIESLWSISNPNIISIQQSYARQISDIKRALESKKIISSVYKAYFNFQDALNKVLDQQIKVIFVFVDSQNNPILYDITNAPLSHTLKVSKTSSGNNTLSYKNPQGKKEKWQLQNDSEHDMIDATFSDVTARFKIAMSHHYKNLNHKKSGSADFGIVMYKPGGIWQGARVQSQGSINEAYAEYVLKNLQLFHKLRTNPINDIFKTAGDNEHRVKIFICGMTNEILLHGQTAIITLGGVQNVDNISGLLQGDIREYSNAGTIEYAIKSENASVLGLSQGLLLASIILKSAGTFGKDDLKKYQTLLNENSTNLNQAILDGSEENALQTLANYLQGLGFVQWLPVSKSGQKTSYGYNTAQRLNVASNEELHDVYFGIQSIFEQITEYLQ